MEYLEFFREMKFTKENEHIQERLAKYETPKNSNNSNIPHLKDENCPKRKSLREKSGLKPVGQIGRKGNTLKMLDNPDITKNHTPNYCQQENSPF